MDNFQSIDSNKKISPWQKPGGTLGMIVAGIAIAGGVILINKILPFLISLTTNILTLSLLVIALLAIAFLITNKQFRKVFSMSYFLIMRKITGLVIEIDPIAIVEHKVSEMKSKILEIQKNMGSLNGLNQQNERRLNNKKNELEHNLILLEEYKNRKQIADASVVEKQVVRLKASIQRQIKRLEDSKKWYEILKQLKHAAELTVQDTENEVKERKEEFESIKAQHKAFSSIMSIMKGNPDQMEDFTRAMDYMAFDITQKLGEMSNVIDETGGLLAQISVEEGVSSKKADELLKQYEQNGIDGLFSTFKVDKQRIAIENNSENVSFVFNEAEEVIARPIGNVNKSIENKYF